MRKTRSRTSLEKDREQPTRALAGHHGRRTTENDAVIHHPTAAGSPGEGFGSETTSPTPRTQSRSQTLWEHYPDRPSYEKSSAPMTPLALLHARRKPMDPHLPRKVPHRRRPWSLSLLAVLVTAASFILLFSIIHSFLNRQIEPPGGCQGPYMRPAYIKFTGFDTEHTRFASKYSLYLYREDGLDEYSEANIGLHGAPVLFLPGNAGSYKQVRSYAAEASQYFHDVVRHEDKSRGLDFFMIDFNEDLAAFHGQTLLDQADYVNEAIAFILALYHDPDKLNRDPGLPDPSSVILIGHSMGGIVARTVLTTANYQSNSVNTIITMSTPHSRPPVSFDADMVTTYQKINDFWRQAYSQRWASDNPLWHVTLLSIAGGGLDTVVPSDYASISSLVPETHGFTVFTSTMPNVWTAMDHLAITWCDSFRKVVVKSLYDIVDVRRPAQTRPRADRVRLFRKRYLTGLESSSPKSLGQKDPNTLLTLGQRSVSKQSRVTLPMFGQERSRRATLLPIPNSEPSGTKLSLLTNQALGTANGNDILQVLFCSAFPLQHGHSPSHFPEVIDLSDGTPDSTRLACTNPRDDAIVLPASTRTSKYPFDQASPFNYLEYDTEQLEDHQFVAVIDLATEPANGWLQAELANRSESVIDINTRIWSLILWGINLRLPSGRPILTDIHIPAAHSSLLAYTLTLGNHGCGDGNELFTPLLRQYLSSPYESKYFVNLKQANINLHGIAPFIPASSDSQEGLSFQLWSDRNCDTTIDFKLRVDILGSMGKLVMRYRTIFAAFPLLIVALVLRKQFQIYNNSGVFITFTESLDMCIRSSLPWSIGLMVAFLLLGSNSSNLVSPESGLLSHWQTNSTTPAIQYVRNDLLLGSHDGFFWFLVPVFSLVSVGACVAVNYALLTIVHAFAKVYALLTPKKGYIRHPAVPASNFPAGFIASSPRRRLVNTSILIFLVATVIPYQFAYVVACIVQLATCIRALRFASDSHTSATSTTHPYFFNYAFSLLNLMIWILPINLLVLIVWIHNLALHWLTPFSSHHNVLSVMPFIVLVETLSSGHMIPRLTGRLQQIVTQAVFFALAATAGLYGVTYAYRLHHVANGIAAWLWSIHVAERPGMLSVNNVKSILEGDLEQSQLVQPPVQDEDEVKKRP